LCKLESITKEKFSLEQKTLTLSTKPLEKKVRVRKAIKTTLKTYKIAAKIV
jgi:hypothetical protein